MAITFQSMLASAQGSLQAKTVTATTSQQVVTPDQGYNGLSQVTVNAIPVAALVTTAGTSQQSHTPDPGEFYNSVTINPTPSQTKSVTPTTSAQVVTPDSGYLLDEVDVDPIPSEYIVPSGSITITGNSRSIDVRAKATAMVNVQPTRTRLWRNSNISTSFTAQTITLDSGLKLSDYDYIEVNWDLSASDGTDGSIMAKVSDFSSCMDGNASKNNIAMGGRSSSARLVRYLSYFSDTQIAITNCATTAGGTANSWMIPVDIYGVKMPAVL